VAHRRHSTLTPLAEARAALLAAAPAPATAEVVPVEDALGRVTAEAVRARNSVPHYHGAAMDGIAVRAADTASASEASPVVLEHGTPATVGRPFSRVDTGNALPAWADAVVMIERVYAGAPAVGVPAGPSAAADPRSSAVRASPASHALGSPAPDAADDCCALDDAPRGADASAPEPPPAGASARVVHLRAAATPWQHVRLVGEDVVAGEPLLPRGHVIRPYDAGALLAAGIVEVAVRPRPVVAIVPTGDELIEPGAARRPGRIVEFNSRMIAAFVREWGGEPRRLAAVGDNVDAVRARIALAARDADVVCVIAGSSAGEHDFTAEALASLGTILVHGIAVMPGKPAIVARLDARLHDGDGTEERASGAPARARVALGIPGYPVSAAVVCRELLAPLLAHLARTAPIAPPTLRAITPARLASRAGQEEMLRVTLAEVGGRRIVTPLARGAGAITSLVRADGIVRLASAVESIEAGEEVEVELLRPLAAVRGTIVLAGSNDPVLAVLEDVVRARRPEVALAVRPLGSGGGLAALERGEVHGASVCVASPDGGATERAANDGVANDGAANDGVANDGVANDGAAVVSWLRRLRATRDVVVLHVVRRRAGLIVAPGNPLGLRAADDLHRPDVRTPPEVERSAVRHRARPVAMTSLGPSGSEELEMTALALASAVQSGLADAAFGSGAAAAALGLGFVPLAEEEHLLVLRGDLARSDAGRALVAALGSAEFRDAAARLAGCDAARAGEAASVGV